MAENMNDKDIELNIGVNIEEAQRNIKTLREQAERLADIADQGERHRDGFVTERQVELYKNISKEMEDTYQQHYENLAAIESDYSRKIDDANREVERRQSLLMRSQGDNKWGDVSSEAVQGFHQEKLEEAVEKLADLTDVEVEIGKLSEQVSLLENQRRRGQYHQGRIAELNVETQYGQDLSRGAMQMTQATAATTTLLGTFMYGRQGAEMVRDAELLSAQQRQRSQDFDYSDSNIRVMSRETGQENQYGNAETLALMDTLSKGGTSDVDLMMEDIQSTQEFSRAYATDPTALAEEGNILQRMGALEEGDMRKFAELIAGAIQQSDMGGREEELIRSTSHLSQSVSRGLAELTDKQMGNIIANQAMLGEAIPSLRGERGAEMLQTLDESIKTGDAQFDLIMGRGTDFVGIEGMYELERLKEEGIANPETMQRFIRGTEDRLGMSPELQAFAMKEHLNLSINQQEALWESGVMDKWRDGVELTEDDASRLAEMGHEDLAEQIGHWEDTQAHTVEQNKADNEAIKEQFGVPQERSGTWIMEQIHKLPDWVQHAGMVGGGILGTIGAMKGRQWLQKKISPKAGPPVPPSPPPSPTPTPPSTGGRPTSTVGRATEWMRNTTSRATDWARNAPGRATDWMKNAPGRATDWMKNAPGRATDWLKDAPNKTKSTLGRWAKSPLGKTAGKLLGPMGTALTIGETANWADKAGDWVFGYNEGDEKIGLNPFKDYGTYEDSLDPIWKRMFNKDDSVETDTEDLAKEESSRSEAPETVDSSTESPTVAESTEIESLGRISHMEVETLNIQDQAFSELMNRISDTTSSEEAPNLVTEETPRSETPTSSNLYTEISPRSEISPVSYEDADTDSQSQQWNRGTMGLLPNLEVDTEGRTTNYRNMETEDLIAGIREYAGDNEHLESHMLREHVGMSPEEADRYMEESDLSKREASESDLSMENVGLEGLNKVDHLEVETLNVQDQAFVDLLDKISGTTASDEYRPSYTQHRARQMSMNNEHTIRVTIDGRIEGMDESNQSQVKDSMVDFFSKPTRGFEMMMNPIGTGINLAYDYFRS